MTMGCGCSGKKSTNVQVSSSAKPAQQVRRVKKPTFPPVRRRTTRFPSSNRRR